MHESYDWIVGCIYSCKNQFHIDCCKKLIDLFESQFKSEEKCYRLVAELLVDLDSQETAICVEV